MKPVDQTRRNTYDGNCWAAAIASILEVPIEDVDLNLTAADKDDDAEDHQTNWWRRMNDHLNARFGVHLVAYLGDEPPPAGYSIAVGTSVRNTPHCYDPTGSAKCAHW